MSPSSRQPNVLSAGVPLNRDVFLRTRIRERSGALATAAADGLPAGVAVAPARVPVGAGADATAVKGRGGGAGTARAPEAAHAGQLSGVRVLLVEDDDDSREVIRIVLKRYGAEVVEASSVPEALAKLRLSIPDVLISDIGMPEEDGYSLLRKLRALPDAEGGRVPAMALTAFARKEDRDRALRDGFQLHMTKPISPAVLSAAVAQLARR